MVSLAVDHERVRHNLGIISDPACATVNLICCGIRDEGVKVPFKAAVAGC